MSAGDADEGLAARTRYRLSEPGAEDFSIDASSGAVSVARPLDREVVEAYTLTVSGHVVQWEYWVCNVRCILAV